VDKLEKPQTALLIRFVFVSAGSGHPFKEVLRPSEPQPVAPKVWIKTPNN